MKHEQNNFAALSGTANSGALDMAALMELYAPATPKLGTIVEGTVVAKVKGGVMVSIGCKADSLVTDGDELELGQSYQFLVVGEQDEATDAWGLSFKLAEVARKREEAWSLIESAVTTGSTVQAWVHSINKSKKTDRVAGINANVGGVQCFIPRSEVTIHGRLDSCVHTELPVVVLSADRKKGRNGEVILSHSKALAKEALAYLETLKVGDVLKGDVVRIIDAGVLVNLGNNLTGLVFRGEVAGDRNANANDFVKVGEEVEVKVIGRDLKKGQVKLSMREAKQDRFLATLNEGDVIDGVVARFENCGAFVLIGNCIDGLLHNADFAHQGGRHERLQTGQTIQVKVTMYDRERRRISLSRKALQQS